MINYNYISYSNLLNDLRIKENYFSITDDSNDYECMELLRLSGEFSFETIQKKYEVFDQIIKSFFKKYEIKNITLYLANQHMYSKEEFEVIKKIKSTEFITALYHELKNISERKPHVCYFPNLCFEIER